MHRTCWGFCELELAGYISDWDIRFPFWFLRAVDSALLCDTDGVVVRGRPGFGLLNKGCDPLDDCEPRWLVSSVSGEENETALYSAGINWEMIACALLESAPYEETP
jgi:hypothetical protein